MAIALAKSSIAGRLGVQVDLSELHGDVKKNDAILFSESQGRMLISVRRNARKEFEKAMKGIAFSNIGEVVQDASVSITLPGTKVELPLAALTESYRSFFKQW